jgi:hypothetical protein
MNALFLKDLADKTRRGLRGRVEPGKSGGGLCYGFKVKRATGDDAAIGDREIVPAEAEVIRRIFRDYAAGVSPKALAKRLNAERCQGPGEAPWNPSTIHGNPARGTGILRIATKPTIRVGHDRRSRAANRGRRAVEPGEGTAARNAPRGIERQREAVQSGAAPEVPLLRSNEVRGVRRRVRDVLARSPRVLRRTVPRHLHDRLTISRQEVEERVLVALREKLMRRDLFEDFCREYVRELNRLRMEHRAGLSSARTELARAEKEIRKLVQAIKDGISALSIKDELLSLEARKAELQSRLNAPEMPELLHPRMAEVYREKVGSLCSALESEESRTGAVEAIRALIETILLEPDGDKLKITLKGDLAGMLSAARDSKRSPDTGDLLVQIKLVAGACSQRYLQLWSGAA